MPVPLHALVGEDILNMDLLCGEHLPHLLQAMTDLLPEAVSRLTQARMLENLHVTLAFFQPSTRTFSSFHVGAQALGAHVLPLADMSASSSTVKGESLEDTLAVLSSISDLLVVRHKDLNTGSTKNTSCPVISAGSGWHPTQALGDFHCLHQAWKGAVAGKTVTFLGDARKARTVISLAALLAHQGARLRFICPPEMGPGEQLMGILDELNVDWDVSIAELAPARPGLFFDPPRLDTSHLEALLPETDALYVTRVQKEHYLRSLQIAPVLPITSELLAAHAKPGMLLLHPLPRQEEMPPACDAYPGALYFGHQLRSAHVARMVLMLAVLDRLP